MMNKQEATDAIERLLNQAIAPMVRDATQVIKYINLEKKDKDIVKEVIKEYVNPNKSDFEGANNGR